MDDWHVCCLLHVVRKERWQAMKYILCWITGCVFIFSVTALAADKTATFGKNESVKPVIKTAKMHATGKVVEIKGTTIKIERNIKGEAGIIEFVLEKFPADIGVNDFVKIDYVDRDGILTALKVNKIILKNKDIGGENVSPARSK